jgi:acyl-CoA reductase-like NAD-dependent aldehyde dehydrogenase
MLTDEQINAAYEAADKSEPYIGAPTRKAVARAIEAEVRKQDDELIRQMLEALDSPNVDCTSFHHCYVSSNYSDGLKSLDRFNAARTAARARLGEGGGA